MRPQLIYEFQEMQARLEEAEAQSLKGGRKALAKLDAKYVCQADEPFTIFRSN